MVDSDEPVFVWRDAAKFKRLTAESGRELDAITGYGLSLARILMAATQAAPRFLEGTDPGQLREQILATQQFVGLPELLSLCWAVGIPVIHLRVFPLDAKRMSAMAVRVGNRVAVLLARDAEYPAPIAYYVAHELGHLAAGHVVEGKAVVDLGDPLLDPGSADEEERIADRFGLQLLTGEPEFAVDTKTQGYTAAALASSVLNTAPQVRVEPGTLALCFGHTTSDWPRAHAAMKLIYTKPSAVWLEVNRIAHAQLDWEALPDDLSSFLQSVMGV